ncbi:hypothetical protein pb186bvf_004552 [Paramecium bursaria]
MFFCKIRIMYLKYWNVGGDKKFYSIFGFMRSINKFITRIALAKQFNIQVLSKIFTSLFKEIL